MHHLVTFQGICCEILPLVPILNEDYIKNFIVHVESKALSSWKMDVDVDVNLHEIARSHGNEF